MNIKFGMDNYYVRYLKRFLNHELGISNRVLGNFDKSDQASLISYLNLPNVKGMFDVQKEITEQFPELNTLFNISLKDNELQWTGIELSEEISNWIKTNLNEIKDYCSTVGWEVSEVNQWLNTSFDVNKDGVINNVDLNVIYDLMTGKGSYSDETRRLADVNLDGEITQTDYDIVNNYINNNSLYITIKQQNRKNYFPNEDMKVFINQFDGTFLYNYCIGEEERPHIDELKTHKIALYLCKKNQKVTIAHNSPNTQKLIIGCSKVTLLENVDKDYLDNVVTVDLQPGEGYQYTCTKDAVRLCIECASSYKELDGSDSITVTLRRGDINFDGVIDMQDYALLADYTAEGPGAEKLRYNRANWTPTSKQLAVMDIPIPEDSGSGIAGIDGKITRADAIELYRFITHQSTQTDLGYVNFTYSKNTGNVSDTNNVDNLLIIDGHYDRSVNIPFSEFTQDDWIIHEKFFNYLLNMAIHKYSNKDDITYLQKLIRAAHTSEYFNKNYFYPGQYDEDMLNALKDIQKTYSSYSVGDLNSDGKLDEVDLELEKDILECLNANISGKEDGSITQEDFDLLNNYLNGTGTLTEEQLSRADINMDGTIDIQDLAIIQDFLEGRRQNIMQITNMNRNYVLTRKNKADINKDGKWNKDDYKALQDEIEGITQNLTNYNITFMLGWCDVQTEALLEQTYNQLEQISEVSK